MAVFRQLLAVLAVFAIVGECTCLYKRDLPLNRPLGNNPTDPSPSAPKRDLSLGGGERPQQDAYPTHPLPTGRETANQLLPRPPRSSRRPPLGTANPFRPAGSRRTTKPPKPRQTNPPQNTKSPSAGATNNNQITIIAVSVVISVVVVVAIIAVVSVIVCLRKRQNASNLRDSNSGGQTPKDGVKMMSTQSAAGNVYVRSSSGHNYTTVDDDNVYLEVGEGNSPIVRSKMTSESKRTGPLPPPPNSAELPSDYIEFTSEAQQSPPPDDGDVYTYVESQRTHLSAEDNEEKRNSSASYYG